MDEGPILLAEDDPRTVELFIHVLRMNDIQTEIVVARDGVEALDYLFGTGDYAGRDITRMPRLVILDGNMPHMGGLETLRRIRTDRRTQFLPVVMFSSTAFTEDVMAAYRLGANSFLDKLSYTPPFPDLVPLMVRYWMANIPPPLGR
jgi:two-component system response regulator